MLEIFKSSYLNQYLAALCTLKLCADNCPDSHWEGLVHGHKFCQAVFHTLFFTDVYLGPNLGDFREQPFHRENAKHFADYEELEDRKPVRVYTREFIDRYIGHCRQKAERAINVETEESLAGASGFDWLKMTRAEIYPYNIRHIQHHAAQLILRMRIDGTYQAGWVKSGWHET